MCQYFIQHASVNVENVSSALQKKKDTIGDKKLHEAYTRGTEYLCSNVLLVAAK